MDVAVIRLLLKSVSPTLGTGGALGSAVSVSPDSPYRRIIPLGVAISVGGTFTSNETVTVRITSVFDDGTTVHKDFTFTATGDYVLTEADLQSLWKNGVGVARVDAQAGSNKSSTSVTVGVSVRGTQH